MCICVAGHSAYSVPFRFIGLTHFTILNFQGILSAARNQVRLCAERSPFRVEAPLPMRQVRTGLAPLQLPLGDSCRCSEPGGWIQGGPGALERGRVWGTLQFPLAACLKARTGFTLETAFGSFLQV